MYVHINSADAHFRVSCLLQQGRFQQIIMQRRSVSKSIIIQSHGMVIGYHVTGWCKGYGDRMAIEILVFGDFLQ